MGPVEQRSPLRKLYDSVTEANGWSTRDVERRIALDGGIKRSNLNRVVNARPLESISLNAILSIADGLGIAPVRVAVAAIESMGIRIHLDSITPAEAIARDETLSADTKAALMAILHTARKPSRRQGDTA